MATVTYRNTVKRYNDPQTGKRVTAVNDLNLEIRDGEFLVLVGPSGCGKTTALRMLAGLEEISGGEILIDDVVVNDLASRDRNIAMVFQNYALYPHMSVYDNMAFGLRIGLLPPWWKQVTDSANTKRVKAEIDARIQEAAELLGIKHLLDRKPKALSGGQRQRVALGRAIVRHPKVFLMDEPLSNLDAKLRVQTRAEIVKLHRRLGVTTIYVTHDQVEAMTMGQRIAVMRDGVLQQCDAPLELYHRPANLFVAGFLGTPSMNFVDAEVSDAPTGGVCLNASAFRVPIAPDRAGPLRAFAGKKVIFGIRPEHIALRESAPEAWLAGGTFVFKVDVVESMGAQSTLYLASGETTLLATVSAESRISEGATLAVVFDPDRIHLFDPETERALI